MKEHPAWQLAQINVARIKGINMQDPVMQEFVDNLDRVNALAETSPGFIWRLKEENNNATSINPYNDEQVIINVSVWENMENLELFVYKTFHTDFLRRRKEWFQKFGKAYMAMWWIPANRFPSIDEAVASLAYLQANGSTEKVFDFRTRFPAPGSDLKVQDATRQTIM